MAYNASVIVDTSFFVAFICSQDSNHSKSMDFLEHLLKNYDVYISNYIYLEFATIASQRIGKEGLRNILSQFPLFGITEIFISEDLHDKIKKEFVKLVDKNISFVDLSTSYIAKKHNIENVLTFDKHFKKVGKQYGFKVLGC